MDNKTITLNSEELEILTELFSEIAALEYPVSETPEYDALWDKIISQQASPIENGAAGIQFTKWHIKPPFVFEIVYIKRVNKRSPYERLEEL